MGTNPSGARGIEELKAPKVRPANLALVVSDELTGDVIRSALIALELGDGQSQAFRELGGKALLD
jgi:hypothetical protein